MKEASWEGYNTEWFLKELDKVRENPVISGLASQFNRYIAKIRGGEWGPNEKWIAEFLLKVGMAEEDMVAIPDFLEMVRVEPLCLNNSFVGFMSRLREKIINRQEFSRDELLLVSRLLLVGVPEEKVIEIKKTKRLI